MAYRGNFSPTESYLKIVNIVLAHMSKLTYIINMYLNPDKKLVWLSEAIKTPPFSPEARLEAGILLRRLQKGQMLTLPSSRPMPDIGSRCHELRINDTNFTWRIFYRIDTDAIVLLEIIIKKTPKTPLETIKLCKDRIKFYEKGIAEWKKKK